DSRRTRYAAKLGTRPQNANWAGSGTAPCHRKGSRCRASCHLIVQSGCVVAPFRYSAASCIPPTPGPPCHVGLVHHRKSHQEISDADVTTATMEQRQTDWPKGALE